MGVRSAKATGEGGGGNKGAAKLSLVSLNLFSTRTSDLVTFLALQERQVISGRLVKQSQEPELGAAGR